VVLVPVAWAVRGTILARCSSVVQVCVLEAVCSLPLDHEGMARLVLDTGRTVGMCPLRIA
jgi:hypothetical protein